MTRRILAAIISAILILAVECSKPASAQNATDLPSNIPQRMRALLPRAQKWRSDAQPWAVAVCQVNGVWSVEYDFYSPRDEARLMLTGSDAELEYPMRGRPPELIELLPADFLDFPDAYKKARNNNLHGWLRSGWIHWETHSVTARIFPCVGWRLATADDPITNGDFREGGYIVDATLGPHKDYCGTEDLPISFSQEYSGPTPKWAMPKWATGDPMLPWRHCGSPAVVRASRADPGSKMIDLRFTVQDPQPFGTTPKPIPIAVEALIPEGKLTTATSNVIAHSETVLMEPPPGIAYFPQVEALLNIHGNEPVVFQRRLLRLGAWGR